MSFTPVVPPHPDERQPPPPVSPPVIPTFSPNHIPTTPAWMGHPQAQANPAAFPSTPYGMPQGVPPGSYFPPPSALPNTGGIPPLSTPIVPLGANGFSVDFTGFPQYQPNGGITYQSFPQYVGPSMQPGAQPGMPPGAGPSMFHPGAAGATPWHPASAFATPFVQPVMAGVMPGVMHGVMHSGMPGVMHTPFPMAQMLHHQPPPPAPAPPPPAAHQRAYRSHDLVDKFDKFDEQHYGPILDAFLVKVVKATVEINPLLTPPPDRPEDRPYLKWNMLWPTGQCRKSSDPGTRSWSLGRNAPATWPRVQSLRLISRSFPWIISIEASNPDEGVTCGDVIESIHEFMYGRATQGEMDSAPQKELIARSYYHNRSTAPDVPGGRLMQTLLHLDWLGFQTMFGGIVEPDERCLREVTSGVRLPCTFELKCLQRYPMTEEELREQQAREEEEQRQERRTRRRSRANSRVHSRAPSRAPTRPPSRADVTSVDSTSTTSDTDT